MCYYGNNSTGKEMKVNHPENYVTVDRTSWMDLALGRFRPDSTILLPMDLSLEYSDHLQEPVRVTKKNKEGNPVASYLNAKADHAAHARTYAEIALGLFGDYGENQNISGVM